MLYNYLTDMLPCDRSPSDAMSSHHRKKKILIVAYPKQGHINPALRFSDHLIKLGVEVTFATSLSVIRRIDMQTNQQISLTFAPFSDGHDEGQLPTTTVQQFVSEFAANGVCAVEKIINTALLAGQPFDHLVYTTALPWAAKVANAHSLKSTLLWCQPATILAIYYYYFNGYKDLISCNNNNPKFSMINLPGLPPLTTDDLPTSPKEHDFVIEMMKEHIDALKKSPRILVNTFDELEFEPIRAIKKLVMRPVGPLVPLYNSIGCDLFDRPQEDYVKWLSTKPKSSVVYVSFGTLSTLAMDQAEEMASGLLKSGRPFLWVIRDGDQVVSKIEELKKQGMIVSWCSQVEVLNHQSIGCFITHCGWNSTMEALAAGVPTVAYPQLTDQGTNAKMIEDVWKTGVRVKKRKKDGMVEGEEIKRCVEMVMEDGEIRTSTEKWREIARKALNNGGLSALNLQAFLDDA